MSTLLDQIVSVRPYCSSKRPEIYNRAYRTLIKKSYKRTRPRKVFKTPSPIDHNPVYVIKYSPSIQPGQDHRVIAVGDEHGYLSILRAKLEVKRKNEKNKLEVNTIQSREEQMEQIRRDTTALSIPSVIPAHPDDPTPPIQPILYTLAWNSNGTRILGGYGDGTLRIWDLGKDFPVCSFTSTAYTKSIKGVAWADNDATIISCSRTNEICVHDNRMRNPLVNRIDCDQLKSKLSDISVIYPYVLSSSSNQSQIHLWDLRRTYKLYKKVSPVETFDLHSPGYTNLAFDRTVDDKIFALGSDSKVRSFNWRTGSIGTTYRVPSKVDYFSKVDVDCVADVMICGTSGFGAYLYDLKEKEEVVDPFWELNPNSNRRRLNEDELLDGKDTHVDKENGEEEGIGRACCAVGLGSRRMANDGFVQIATGGDDSFVTVWD